MDVADLNKHFSGKPKREKLIRTLFLVLVWICLGLFLEITGPTLIDLKLRLGVDFHEIATAVASSNIGLFISLAIGGVVVDKCLAYCDLLIALALSLAAMATAAVPWAPTVNTLWGIILTFGIFEGTIAVSGQKLILIMWRKHAASPMNILHFRFGIGSFMNPLIANPFLAVERPDPPTNATTTTRTLHENVTSVYSFPSSKMPGSSVSYNIVSSAIMPTEHKSTLLRESRIEFSYLITAAIILIISVTFYIFFIIDIRQLKAFRHKNDKHIQKNQATSVKAQSKSSNLRNLLNLVNPGTCADGKTLYGFAIFTGLILFYFNIVGGERMFAKFIRAYSIEQLGFSVDDGSYINTAFWISFAVGRFSGFVAARWIPIRILFLIETGGALVSSILLNIFAHNSSLALWILIQFLAFFHGPCFPTGMAWGDYHVNMSGVAICVVLLGGSVGGVVYLELAGLLFDRIGPRVFLYITLGYGIASFSLAIVLNLIGSRYPNRFENGTLKDETQAVGDVSNSNDHSSVDK